MAGRDPTLRPSRLFLTSSDKISVGLERLNLVPYVMAPNLAGEGGGGRE